LHRLRSFVAAARDTGSLPDIAIGIGVLLLAGVVALATRAIHVSPGYAFVGPRAFPYGIAAFLALVGTGLVMTAIGRSRAERSPRAPQAAGGTAFWWVLGGFAANLIALSLLGFIFAAAIQYVLTAHGFGSRRWWRDALCGLVLASAAYFLFSWILQINIPPGPVLEMLLP
jgi:putative tricarboxylic transport membrane protein